ncbi:MAG: branched-chain amino acid ABC transporter permease [Thermodesulfobacteriota bacterium]
MDLFLEALVNGASLGMAYALAAIGLTIIWGVMEIINFAHGDYLMLAMYISFFSFSLLGIHPLFSIPITFGVLAVLGALTYLTIIKGVLKSNVLLSQIVVTFGISIFLQNGTLFVFSPNFRAIANIPWLTGSISIGGIFLPKTLFIVALVSLITCLALFYFIHRTTTGKTILAMAMDREMVQLVGVNADRVELIAFSLGIATLGIAGSCLMMVTYVSPRVGFLYGLIAFTAVALGGFGSIPGTIIAGVIIGVTEIFTALYIGPEYKYVAIFVVYLLILIWRPKKGLLGW